MAGMRLQPPEQFDFSNPDSWGRWKRRFQQFRLASGLANESAERQISTLLYSMGEEAEDVLLSTDITAEQRRTYDGVVGKLDDYFGVRANTIYERARFNSRSQQAGESAEQYILALYRLAENCDYDHQHKEQTIRDRLVVGIRDKKLSERLQMDRQLTLDKAKQLIRQAEAVRDQNETLHGEAGESKSNPIHIDAVQKKPPQTSSRNSRTRFHKLRKNCTRCGRGSHRREKCPARDAECHRCGRRGHYSAQCFSKTTGSSTLNAAHTTDVDIDSSFLDTVTTADQSSWTATVKIGTQEVDFKLDTGAEVTAISDAVHQTLKDATLSKPSKILYGPDRTPLAVTGEFVQTLTYNLKTAQQQIFVVKGLKTNLLGLPAITALQLAARVDATDADFRTAVAATFPTLFQGLGTLGEPYEIELTPDAKPYALYTPRRVPYPLRDKVKEELERMEALGVISKVDEPSLWCAGMVAVPKKSGAVRICVDLKHLNQNVLRETHPLPKVDDVLAQLSGATLFSKLDANSGFWQIPLAPSSRHLTTFITPFGRYEFNKLPFGISSAPELFQKRMGKMLAGLDGVVCLIDDVLVFAGDQEEHDARLTAVLRRIQSAGATLNLEKCSFRQKELRFLGHILGQDGLAADPEKTRAIANLHPPGNLSELRRFMGMANQLGKFSPNLADLSHPLRQLLSTKNAWVWGPEQEAAFSLVKAELTKPSVLVLYNPAAETKITADSSSFGLGAVLMQKQQSTWRPVAFASRSLSETESRYAQIEKEALACTRACDKFSDYVLGKKITLETDHKPLITLLSSKNLDSLPPRILRFRLRLSRFQYDIQHVPGKLLYTANALSRDPDISTSPFLTRHRLLY